MAQELKQIQQIKIIPTAIYIHYLIPKQSKIKNVLTQAFIYNNLQKYFIKKPDKGMSQQEITQNLSQREEQFRFFQNSRVYRYSNTNIGSSIDDQHHNRWQNLYSEDSIQQSEELQNQASDEISSNVSEKNQKQSKFLKKRLKHEQNLQKRLPKYIMKHFFSSYFSYPVNHIDSSVKYKMNHYVQKHRKILKQNPNTQFTLKHMRQLFGQSPVSSNPKLWSQTTRRICHKVLTNLIRKNIQSIPKTSTNQKLHQLKAKLIALKIQRIRSRSSQLMVRVRNH